MTNSFCFFLERTLLILISNISLLPFFFINFTFVDIEDATHDDTRIMSCFQNLFIFFIIISKRFGRNEVYQITERGNFLAILVDSISVFLSVEYLTHCKIICIANIIK